MKISIVATSGIYPLHIGGPANVGYFLAKEFGKAGHEVTVFVRVKNKDELEAIKKLDKFTTLINVIFVPTVMEYNKKSILNVFLVTLKVLNISRAYCVTKCDVVLYNSPPVDLSLAFPLISRARNITQFMIFHGYGGLIDNKNIFGRWLIRIQKSFFNKFIVVSKHTQNIPYLFGITQDKIRIIHNGIETNKKFVSNSNFKLCGNPKILYVGLLAKHKGIDTLLKAFYLLLKSHPNSILYIVGSGKEKDNLIDMCKEMSIENNVVFTGYMSQEIVANYYYSCDFLVIPSVKEAFGITFLESMFYRIPAIISDADGGLKEIASNGARCSLFRCGNHNSLSKQMILLINKSKVEIKEITDSNFDHVIKNYSWCIAAQKYLQLFEEKN